MNQAHPNQKGRTMRSKMRWLFALAAVVALALAVSACGDDSDDSGETSSSGTAAVPEEFAPPLAAPDDAAEGGDLTVLAASDVDYMDPGAAYYQFTWMITTAGHRQLLSWAPDDVEQATPDGAEDYPEVSDDNQTLTFTIRDGMKFAPPVDREITAADYEYAIERALLPGVANGYAGYLSDIVGFEDAQDAAAKDPTGGAPDIEGVTATDDKTLEVQLDKPSAYVVEQALSLPISAPVPEEYAKEFDAENPSTYGDHVVFSGPYMVENDASGELTGYTSGREIQMVRNPNWDGEATGDFRPAYVDSISIEEGFDDPASASRKVLSGEATVNGDFVPPPNVLKEAATESEAGQLTLTPSGGNRYISLNTQIPPFDNIDVRKAVIANSDREALRNTRGGELVGPVATHFIPPLFPGFEEAGGVEGDTSLDFIANPNGDPDLAADYMKKAGYDSGKCEGDCKITMVGDDISPGKDTAEVFRGQLEELGFDVEFRPVAHDIMYTRFCSVPEQEPEVCPNVGWLKDFNDAQSMLEITFSGDNIDPENNSNWSQLDVPEINKAIADARLINDPDERAQTWGDIDSQIMAQAPAVPWVWDNQANVKSADVLGVINQFNANWDLSFTSLPQD
jgi:peptide/nickel transport system substrate-binding protein